MTYKDRYKDILYTQEDLKKRLGQSYCIENNIIKEVNIVVTGHFGNCVSLDMLCYGVCPIPLYNSTGNIGYILRALIDIFDKEQDDSVKIKELNGTPIRIVFDNKNVHGGKSVAIGHFMKDRFVFIEDLMKLKE